jgi:hypothetical protein
MQFSAVWCGRLARVLPAALAMTLIACGGSGGGSMTVQAPAITTQPASQTITGGQTATLMVAASGSSPLSYQWYQGSSGDTSTPVGSDSSTYSTSPLSVNTSYWVRVSNSAGSVSSASAEITVLAPPPGAVPAGFFGMQMNGGTISQQPWPAAPFGAVRLWDASVSWLEINPSNGNFDFTNLDKWLERIPQHNADILYTFGRTPAWASSNPTDSTCGLAPGTCDPPNDLNADGTGSDQHWKDFVTAIVQHSVNSSKGHIKYWEIWNEAANPPTWTGTVAQTVRMTTDAVQIIHGMDPSAVVLSPSVIIESSSGLDFLQNYLQALQAAGGGVDGIAVHGYVQLSGQPLVPESILRYLNQTHSILTAAGQGAKALFDTEASWGDPSTSNPAFTDPEMQAGFVAKMYLLQWQANVARFYWYQWNNDTFGTLWTPDPNNPSAPGTVLPPGIAYEQVYQWMVGAVGSSCTSAGSVWTCELTRSGGYQALAVWDASQSCSNGSCTTSNYTYPTIYKQYRDLSGNVTALTGTTVAIGTRPILLENEMAP